MSSPSQTRTPVALPYFRDLKELPAPIPSVEQIVASDKILKGASKWAVKKVVVVGGYVVKYSKCTYNRLEGDNLLFLEELDLRIPVPKLYAMWEEDGMLYMVMEHLPGVSLDSLWPELSESNKEVVLSKLRGIYEKLRAIPSPGFFGNIFKGNVPHHLWFWDDYPQHISGPFTNERDMVSGLITKSGENAKENSLPPLRADFYRENFLQQLANPDRESVFTHSDLQRKNIIVKEVPNPDPAATNKEYELYIIDWESGGWYPVYWEYVASFFAFFWEDDWPSKVSSIVDPWPAEAAMMKMIHQDLWL